MLGVRLYKISNYIDFYRCDLIDSYFFKWIREIVINKLVCDRAQ